jgi:ankyrin repeat protein
MQSGSAAQAVQQAREEVQQAAEAAVGRQALRRGEDPPNLSPHGPRSFSGWLHSVGNVSFYWLDTTDARLCRYEYYSDPLPPALEEWDLQGAHIRAVGEIKSGGQGGPDGAIIVYAFELNILGIGRRLLAADDAAEFRAWVSVLRQSLSGSNTLHPELLVKPPTPHRAVFGGGGFSLSAASSSCLTVDSGPSRTSTSMASTRFGSEPTSAWDGALSLRRPSAHVCKEVQDIVEKLTARRLRGEDASMADATEPTAVPVWDLVSADMTTSAEEFTSMEDSARPNSIASGSVTLQPLTRTELGLCNVGIPRTVHSVPQPDYIPMEVQEAIINGDKTSLEIFINSLAVANNDVVHQIDTLCSEDGLNLLSLAARSFVRCGPLIRTILAAGADVNNQYSRGGRSALWNACEVGQDEAVVALLSAGALVDAEDEHGTTPLCVACAYGREITVSTLLDSGANPNKGDARGVTPFMSAAGQGHFGIVSLLLDRCSIDLKQETLQGMSVLYGACLHASSRTINLLIEMGAHVNHCTASGMTALHIAAELGKSEIAKVLIGAGAKVDAPNMYGETPLFSAVKALKVKMVHLLLSCGAARDVVNWEGMSLLQVAKQCNHKGIESLLEGEVLVDDLSFSGRSAPSSSAPLR